MSNGNPSAGNQPHPHAQKLHDLQIFLNSVPALIHEEMQHLPPDEARMPRIKCFQLPSGDYISCVLWNSIFHITGTDVVRSLIFRFEITGRPVRNIKKFEQGIFSDLRNLKPGTASVMEEAQARRIASKSSSWLRRHSDLLIAPVSVSGHALPQSMHLHTEEAKGFFLVCPQIRLAQRRATQGSCEQPPPTILSF